MTMPPKIKTAKLGNKGKIIKKRTFGDEDAVSVKTLLTNMSNMLAALIARVDGLDPAMR